MPLFHVILCMSPKTPDRHGADYYAGRTLAEAVEAAHPEQLYDVSGGCVVRARDAGEARMRSTVYNLANVERTLGIDECREAVRAYLAHPADAEP